MLSKTRVLVSLVVGIGLAAAVLSAPSGAATSTAALADAQGVTKDTIEVVLLVPDIDGLKEKGISISNLSTADFVNRLAGYAEAYGPINGRKIVIKPVAWDPIDVTSMDKACISATQDNEPFVVINGSGYQTSSIPCITVDNETPFITGDMSYGALQKGSGKNLVTVSLPSEVAATGAVKALDRAKILPKSTKIGILSNNSPAVKAAGDTLERELKKSGYDVVKKVELNGLAADVGLLGREGTAAVTTFQDAGVEAVFSPQVFLSGFLSEKARTGADFEVFLIDGQANTCTPISVSQVIAAADGATCITAWDSASEPTKDAIKPDNALEAKCRKEHDAATGVETTPGGSGAPRTVPDVGTFPADISPLECNIASFLFPAIEKAGKNPTWDKVYAAILKSANLPTAYLSNGKGGFGKNKPYFTNPVMHFEKLSFADASTPKDEHGLYNGCAMPAPCLVPELVNGQEWFSVAP
jgi:hypothetical protein